MSLRGVRAVVVEYWATGQLGNWATGQRNGYCSDDVRNETFQKHYNHWSSRIRERILRQAVGIVFQRLSAYGVHRTPSSCSRSGFEFGTVDRLRNRVAKPQILSLHPRSIAALPTGRVPSDATTNPTHGTSLAGPSSSAILSALGRPRRSVRTQDARSAALLSVRCVLQPCQRPNPWLSLATANSYRLRAAVVEVVQEEVHLPAGQGLDATKR